jgi:hypothetical protein
MVKTRPFKIIDLQVHSKTFKRCRPCHCFVHKYRTVQYELVKIISKLFTAGIILFYVVDDKFKQKHTEVDVSLFKHVIIFFE